MHVPDYPEFAPVSLDMREELYPSLNFSEAGISEFTFSGLYLFRNTYHYRISRIPNSTFVISGEKAGKRFFSTPCAIPNMDVVTELSETHDFYRHLSEKQVNASQTALERAGFTVQEDRDQFDYLYKREELAELNGKAFHKKRTHVNAFLSSYNYSQRELDGESLPDALGLVDVWATRRGEHGETAAAREGLELHDRLRLRGAVYYVDDKPVGYCLGESLARGRMFAVHFEKADEAYKGVYQFINQAFAQSLPKHYDTINREQDLGDEGLRQAKMTYRPCGFVRKYQGIKNAT